MNKKFLTPFMLVVGLLLLAGCSSDDPPPPVTLTDISVTPATPDDLHVNVTKQFTATGEYSDNSTQNITDTVTWDSSDPATATINANGLARGVAAGTTSITATQSGVSSDAVALAVIDPELTGIRISPATPDDLFVGRTQPFSAEGDYTDGSTLNITDTVTWDSSVPAAATIDANGLAAGVDVGTTNITASLSGISSNVAVLDVVIPVLSSISVSPAQVPDGLPVGLEQQFTATGTFTDESTQDLSTSVTWDSSDIATAEIDTEGLATGLALGATDITASLSGITSNIVDLDVINPTLESITVAPAVVPDPLAVGRSMRFQAEGVFSNNQPYDITDYVTWNSSDLAVATINDSGLATAENAGTTDISASTTTPALSSNEVALTTEILIQDSLFIEPRNPKALPIARQQQFVALLLQDGGSIANVTWDSTWTSSDENVAYVFSGGSMNGIVEGIGTGTATITATDIDTGLSDFFDIEVNAATLELVTITPQSPIPLPAGNTQAFAAIGEFSDGESRVLRGQQESWIVSDTAIAFVESLHAKEAIAVVRGVVEGDVNVVYQDYDVAGNRGPEDTVPLTVTAAILSSIELWPDTDQSAPAGTWIQFTAYGFYAGERIDITNDVNWISSNQAVAVFDIETPGWLTILPGTAGITANVTASMENTANPPELIDSPPIAVTVNDETLVSLQIAPVNSTVTVADTVPYSVLGTYSAGPPFDITEQVTWSSDHEHFATVSNADGSRGQVTGLSVGTATIRVVDPQTGLDTNASIPIVQE